MGSRRACDTLVQAGAVRVNGTVVREPGRRVEPERDRVLLHGRPIPGRGALRHFVLHKPVGVITTMSDPEGRRTVRELLPPGPRLFPVGRLDAETSGLLVFTNDGELAHRLMHPRYAVEKRYRARVAPVPSEEQVRRLRVGVEIERGVISGPAWVRLLSARERRGVLEIRLHEGRYRQVRRMCEAVGLEVKGLQRFGYGPLRLAKLPPGACRPLTAVEVKRLRAVSARPGGTGWLARLKTEGEREAGSATIEQSRAPGGPGKPSHARARRGPGRPSRAPGGGRTRPRRVGQSAFRSGPSPAPGYPSRRRTPPKGSRRRARS